MLIEIMIKVAIALLLVYVSYKDIKERIIPNWTVAVILGLSTVWYFFYRGDIKDYLFYIFIVSVPLLVISYILESFTDIKKNIGGYLVIGVSILVSAFIPVDFKLKYNIACILIIALAILEDMIKKEPEKENDEESLSLGGGDIKLLAGLGPILEINVLIFLFISFLLAFIYMKIKKQNNICLAPFMFIGYLVTMFI